MTIRRNYIRQFGKLLFWHVSMIKTASSGKIDFISTKSTLSKENMIQINHVNDGVLSISSSHIYLSIFCLYLFLSAHIYLFSAHTLISLFSAHIYLYIYLFSAHISLPIYLFLFISKFIIVFIQLPSHLLYEIIYTYI